MQNPGLIRILIRHAFRMRLRYVIVTIVLLCFAAPQVLVLSGLRSHWENQAVEAAIEQLETAWAVAPRPDPSSAANQQAAIGERLTTKTALSGGILYDEIGALVAAFGQRPDLDFLSWQRQGIQRLAEKGGDHLDLYLSPEVTRGQHHMIIRVDRRVILEEGWTMILEMPYWIPIVTGISSLAVIIFLTAFLLIPVKAIKEAALSAMENPDKAAEVRLGWRSNNELGEAGRAIDMLMLAIMTSDTAHRTLSLAQALGDSHIAVFETNGEGLIRKTNRAALSLFQFNTLADFRDYPKDFIRLEKPAAPRTTSLAGITTDASYSGAVTILAPHRNIDAFLSVQNIHNDKDEVIHRNIAIIDLSLFSRNLHELRRDNQTMSEQVTQLKQSREELKQLLETCTLIIGGSPASETLGELRLEQFANEWHQSLIKDGFKLGELTHTTMPLVISKQPLVRDIVRQSLLLLISRASVIEPDIHLSGTREADSSVTFVFEIRRSKGVQTESNAQWSLPFAAVKSLLAEAGGEFISLTTQNATQSPSVIIRLPGDSRKPKAASLLKRAS